MMASLLLTAPRLLFALGILGVAAGHAAAQSEQGEYRLKAVFLYQFPQFVEWPEPAWRDAKAVQLCVTARTLRPPWPKDKRLRFDAFPIGIS
jgi:hypothetical protein